MEAVNSNLESWSDELVRQTSGSACLTIGLISGHREPNDARCVYILAGQLAQRLSTRHGDSDLLVCRLEIDCPVLARFRTVSDEPLEPEIEKSALGNWHEVEVPMTLGQSAPWALKALPRWLPKWKLRYKMILIDLGPINLIPSRTIGRLCDANYLLLGPNSSASAQWILQYVDYHTYCGSHIAGTLVSSFAA
jgi:hypothetical protein